MKERRKTPRAEAPTTTSIVGRCQLVRLDSFGYAYFVAFGWIEIDRAEPDCALMQPPEGWREADEEFVSVAREVKL